MAEYDDTSQYLKQAVEDFHNVVVRHLLAVDERGGFVLNAARFQLIMFVHMSWRPNLLSDESADDLWLNYIRPTPNLTDFIMELASELCFYNSAMLSVIDTACLKYLDSVYEPTAETRDFDADLVGQLFGEKDGKKLLERHRWLRALIFVRMLNLPYILTEVKRMGVTVPPAKPATVKSNEN